jgi:hypothetical protein
MGKLSLLCAAAGFAIATSAYARGGTYHHPEPYVVHPDRHKTHSWAPVIVYSPEQAITTRRIIRVNRPPRLAASLRMIDPRGGC